MKTFPESISFKYPWRSYQKRVLDELSHHINDQHLHIIAPPGSGKTVLGLEVTLRLNQPTLIFAPTLAIRNQWIERFQELFLRTNTRPDWISTDVKKPSFLTVLTFQSAYSACTDRLEVAKKERDNLEGESEIENGKINSRKLNAFVKKLSDLGVKTIVVDEAHHLKNAWWMVLTNLKKRLNPVVVGLTATPPYDVSYYEWQRYTELNGPVDAEISVPELVREGDLCPHQDFVIFSKPIEKEEIKIAQFVENLKDFTRELQGDSILISAIENHPMIQNPEKHLEQIYDQFSVFSACLIFLNSVGRQFSEEYLKVVGDSKVKIPVLTNEWLSKLLQFYLFGKEECFAANKEHQEGLIKNLRELGVFERNKIQLGDTKRIQNLLRSSVGKLNSIKLIVSKELSQLQTQLRMVILTDFIRKDFLPKDAEGLKEIVKIGAIPIFEMLRRENLSCSIGVLTGSLVLLPIEVLEKVSQKSIELGFVALQSDHYPADLNYRVLKVNQNQRGMIVQVVTSQFESGFLNVLIGTKSLLGEGWDAPSINSLILASFVGSYVSSNQMRGRAIRSQRKNSDKTSNIWHLVCHTSHLNGGGEDLQTLERRFKAFVGLSLLEENRIVNGLKRIPVPGKLCTQKEIELLNSNTFLRAAQRKDLKEKWIKALESGTELKEEIRIPYPMDSNYSGIKSMYFFKTIKFAIGMFCSSLVAYLNFFIQFLSRNAKSIKSLEEFKFVLFFFGIGGVFVFGKKAFQAFRMYVKYRDIALDLENIGCALLITLSEMGIVKTRLVDLSVVSSLDENGVVYCHLKGGSNFEKSSFIKYLKEVIAPVDNPRYLIIRKSSFLKVFTQKDYHSVPEPIGKKKEFAESFANHWKNRVGSCGLIFTRNVEGRKVLLKSRMDSLASEFIDPSEIVNKWA